MIPDEILRDVIARAKDSWPNDKKMQRHCIESEKEGYENLQRLEFNELSERRDELIEEAKSIYTDWDEIYRHVSEEVSAYLELKDYCVEHVPSELIREWQRAAIAERPVEYSWQLSFVENKVSKYLSVLATREQVDPLKKLLIELEEIVANECYNGNIQNYSSWGELESEGRKFRYPVKFYTETGETKRWAVPANIPSEELITGHYAFGANELNIYRALLKLVMHLKEKHGLRV